MPINPYFLIEFSPEIWSEFARTCGKSLIVRYFSIRSILIQILYEMAEVLSLHKKARFRCEVLLYSSLILEECGCLARISFVGDKPANKSASLPRNFEAGSNVIDASEPQPQKHSSPMTVTEAGR
jgi:hypothetical protein